jgi:hypothetical protein
MQNPWPVRAQHDAVRPEIAVHEACLMNGGQAGGTADGDRLQGVTAGRAVA